MWSFGSKYITSQWVEYIGEFVEYDPNNNTSIWRNYMRLRVRVDVRLPLKKEKRVQRTGGERCMVSFKFERLGVFCFVCGMLGHTEQKCPVLFSMEHGDGQCGRGVELRAEGRRQDYGAGGPWLKEENGGAQTLAWAAAVGLVMLTWVDRGWIGVALISELIGGWGNLPIFS